MNHDFFFIRVIKKNQLYEKSIKPVASWLFMRISIGKSMAQIISFAV